MAQQRTTTPKRRPARRPAADAPDEAAEIFAAMAGVVTGIQTTFGRNCEVVLHDYRQEDESVVAVAGRVTGRTVGSPMSKIGLALKRRGDAAEDELNYLLRLPDGRLVKSSTVLLRTSTGRVVGALCVNVDVTELRMFAEALADFALLDGAEAQPTAFGHDVGALVDAALVEVERELGQPLARLAGEQWTQVFRALDGRGVFHLRRGVPMVAERLGLSRASAYNHLSRVRGTPAGPESVSD